MMTTASEHTFAIETCDLSKSFGAVKANDRISLKIKKGDVHGIVGENGAGKSTLLKMLFGFYRPDSGSILVNGDDTEFKSPSAAMKRGIGMVHQHFMLVETFTVLENIILGAEGSSKLGLAKQKARTELLKLEQQFGFNLPLDSVVADLPVGTRQRVEILKALYRGAEILILDEPTAVLTPQECDQLFSLIRQLKADGKTVLFVTHKLHEIMAVTDAVTVMRAGQVVSEHVTAETSAEVLAECMVGAKVTRQVMRAGTSHYIPRLKLDDVSMISGSGSCALKNISFEVSDGEVLGVAGVAGNGQTELLEAITGLNTISSGVITFSGNVIAQNNAALSPIMLRRMGMAHVAEDRQKTGMVEAMSAEENIILGYQRDISISRFGVLRKKAIAESAITCFENQDVRPRNTALQAGRFSGGNQQKIVIARELMHEPVLLVIGQPTRGVDIGAVTKIHDQLTALRNAGKAVLVVSADLDELLAISDRIAVMSEGEITGIVNVEDADEQTLGLMMAGERLSSIRKGSA
ncbi:ABC transporter ATP-binding protein [Kordiimonas pumila]|uniref:ABC transporter ATP-binding protein n=1 Tax=Kordiimonas pumila TaxID=2161677 RepID=A0ABV7D8R3_9PROT|nr:ABC transporter ATP-binding protein [Kordiimonas pumila]